MNDLIWVGNTLYPAWMVYGTIGLAIAIVAAALASLGGKE